MSVLLVRTVCVVVCMVSDYLLLFVNLCVGVALCLLLWWVGWFVVACV